MQVNGTVVSVEFDVQIAKKDGGQYPGARFSYRDSTGKLVEQAFHNNSLKYNANLKTQLGNLTNGSGFIMEKEKEGDFWKVVSIQPNVTPTTTPTGSSSVKPNPTTSPKSTYETPEERAARQVYIVRQSSIGHALTYLSANKKDYSVTDILKLAKTFETHVFNLNQVEEKEEFKSDLPWNEEDVI